MARKQTIRDTDYLVISARVKSLETRLLTEERLEQILEAKTGEEAAKLLQEWGYPQLDAARPETMDAALAAVRRQEKQLAAMKTLLDKMDNAYLHGEDYTPYDFEFHSMIAQCTGNDVMMRLLPTIHESIQAGYHHTRRVEGSYQRASQCHLEMYRGILEHDSERARRAAQRHMMQTMHDSGVEVPSVLVK